MTGHSGGWRRRVSWWVGLFRNHSGFQWLGLAWVGTLMACSNSAPCPDGSTWMSEAQGNLVARYCRDAAGLLHGPFRLFEPDDDPDIAVPRGEGSFDRGNADGVFLYRFSRTDLASREGAPGDYPEDPIRYRQEFLQGQWHGTWEEMDRYGRLVARQHYDRGRRCGVWVMPSEGDTPQTQEFTPCDALPELPPGESGDDPPVRSAFWDGSTCPTGRRVSADGEVWCEESGMWSGPALESHGDYEIVGQYRNGRPDGRFVAFHAGRAVREWHVRDGRLEGIARRWYRNGTLAERGEYRDDQAQGTWNRWAVSGNLLERQDWDQGLRHGLQQRFVPGGTVVEEVPWVRGLREGVARTFQDDGSLECEGRYQADLRQGDWTCWHPNGTKFLQGPYERGSRQGIFRQWTPDGAPVFEGPYQHGTPEGTWRFFQESHAEDPEDQGRLTFQGTYRAGLREGWWEYRWERDGVLAGRLLFQGDRRHGPSETFYHNGQTELVGNYLDGRQHGPWRLYYRSGAIHIEAVFFQDALDGPYVEYAPDGTVIRRGRYVNNYFIPDPGF